MSLKNKNKGWWEWSYTDDDLVIDNGIKYIPYGYRLTFKNGEPIHTAMLQDLKANSETYASLEKVIDCKEVRKDANWK